MRDMKSIVLLWACVGGLAMTGGGCATITQGTTQPINVDSDPNGADCTLTREGQALSAVTTPAPVTVKRNAATIHVVCKKAGYEDGRVIMNSRFETASAGNVILGGIIGAMVDASSGANTRYESYVMVRLSPLVGGQPPLVQTAPPAKPEAAKPVAAAAEPPTPSPFDGTYSGGLDMGGSLANMRQIEIKVENGKGTGTARQSLCPSPGALDVTIAPSGAVTVQGDLVTAGTCAPSKATLNGRFEGGRLVLEFRTREYVFARQPGRP